MVGGGGPPGAARQACTGSTASCSQRPAPQPPTLAHPTREDAYCSPQLLNKAFPNQHHPPIPHPNPPHPLSIVSLINRHPYILLHTHEFQFAFVHTLSGFSPFKKKKQTKTKHHPHFKNKRKTRSYAPVQDLIKNNDIKAKTHRQFSF